MMTSTLAYSLPEPNVWLFRLSFWGIIAMLTAGGIGIYRASKNQFALYRDTKDVFLSMPVTLLNWFSLAVLLWIGRQDADLLSSMKAEAAQAATVWLGTFAIAVVQARKCNPGVTTRQIIYAGCGRLLLGTMSQLGALLVLAGCLFAFFGNSHGQRSRFGFGSYTSDLSVKLFLISLAASLFQMIWSIVYETDREEVNEKRGWVYGAVNVLLFCLACWGGNLLCEQYELASTDALLRAAERKKPATVRHIIAFNPELSRTEAILAATDNGHRKTLRTLIRTRSDLATARQRAEENGNQQLMTFLK
ncbi:MAG: hypothetical protein IJ498_04265 [Akkermansia sp.]|nr:hypothetical protein [Akkermansia sp.]